MRSREPIRGGGIALLVTTLMALALIPRVFALGIPGHDGDVRVIAGWAERMAEVGPWRFYEGSGAIYPALLYVLWPLGVLLDGEQLALALKALSIPFDLAIGVLLFFIVRECAGRRAALDVAVIYLLNPAVLLAGPVWGQVDSAGTLPFLAALVASAHRRHAFAGAMAVLALLVKPQFGLALLVVGSVAILDARSGARLRPLAAAGLGGAAAYVAVALPLALHPLRYAGLLGGTATQQPMTSLGAFNPWGLVVGFEIPDDPYVGFGTLLLLLGLGAALLGLRRGTSLPTLLAVGAMLVLAFYFLPTRVHERYLFPAMALLAPFAVARPALLAAYVALSAGFAASLLHALHVTTSFGLPETIAGVLVSPPGEWAIGLVLMGSSIAFAWLLLVMPPHRAVPWPRHALESSDVPAGRRHTPESRV